MIIKKSTLQLCYGRQFRGLLDKIDNRPKAWFIQRTYRSVFGVYLVMGLYLISAGVGPTLALGRVRGENGVPCDRQPSRAM